jgi:SAM-dependent methyltransferase
MAERQMFSASADLYDLIYAQFKDYVAETKRLADTIRSAHPEARSVLDVACGTGEHARLLADTHGFEVDALDLDPAFVRIAQGKLVRGSVFQADMTSFSLPRSYDVILCLFSSIGYVRTLDNVTRTLDAFRRHLAPGGLVIVEPWFPPGFLESGRTIASSAAANGVSVCRVGHTQVDGRISRIRFEYLIGRPTGIEHASEVHELGLFTKEEMLACFHAAGLSADYDAAGVSDRGLYVSRSRR